MKNAKSVTFIYKNGDVLTGKNMLSREIPVMAEKSDDFCNPYWICPGCGAILTDLDDEMASEIHYCNDCGQAVKFE